MSQKNQLSSEMLSTFLNKYNILSEHYCIIIHFKKADNVLLELSLITKKLNVILQKIYILNARLVTYGFKK